MVGEAFGGEGLAAGDEDVGPLGAAEAEEGAVVVGGRRSWGVRGFDEPVEVVGGGRDFNRKPWVGREPWAGARAGWDLVVQNDGLEPRPGARRG